MIRCSFCPHHCVLKEGGPPGRCRARACRQGRMVPLNYGQLTSLVLDPISKKPLACFHPGSRVLSVGGFGCNMDCYFCQNDSISCAGEGEVPVRSMSPRALCELALSLRDEDNIGVAFTYNEPLIGYEYVRDCARLLKEAGLCAVVVTNGCFCQEAVEPLFSLIDAWNIDLKGFTEGWYRRLGGDLETVKGFIMRAVQTAHVELTTLVVPGENDSEQEMDSLACWIAALDPGMPLHLSRFFPRRNALDKPPTDRAHLLRLREIAQRHLQRVYLGNV
jgi:pyruvate formate lyase activating enzyme